MPTNDPVYAFMRDSASPVAYMLHAWRRWLPAAMADGSALAHFKNCASVIAGLRWQSVPRSACWSLDLPPSPAALAAGWRADKLVPVSIMPVRADLPTPARIVAEAKAVASVSARPLGLPRFEAYGLIVPALPEGALHTVRLKGGRGVHVATAADLSAELDRARAVLKFCATVAANEARREAARAAARKSEMQRAPAMPARPVIATALRPATRVDLNRNNNPSTQNARTAKAGQA